MLIFGHVGITGGLVKAWQAKAGKTDVKSSVKPSVSDVGIGRPGFFAGLGNLRSVDYRLLSIGALLPDIIDKPVWFFSVENFQWSGRGYSHTLLFSSIVLLSGFALASRHKRYWLLNIAVGSLFHLIFDQMWLDPTALWWPLLGPIQRKPTTDWLSGLWEGLLSNPYVYVSEASGLLLVSYTFFRLLAAQRVMHFIKTGDISLNEPIEKRTEEVQIRRNP